MIDIITAFNQLDPMFHLAIMTALGGLVHRIVLLTQDVHGNTRPFMIVLCMAIGLMTAVIFKIFGQETVLSFMSNWAQFGIGALVFANFIWVWFQQSISALKVKTTTTTKVEPGITTEVSGVTADKK